MTIETDVDLRTAILVVAGLRIGHLIAGDDQGTLQLDRRTTFLAELERLGGSARCVGVSRQTELQVRSLAEDTLGFGGVLNARQLDYDPIGPLTLHQRLSHTKFVDAIAHRGQVLLDRVLTNLCQLGLSQRQAQHELTVALGGGQLEVREVLADQRLRITKRGLIGEAQLHGIFQIRQAAIAHTLLAQQALDLTLGNVKSRLDSLFHVDFQQEVHTTGKVEPQFHRARTKTAQPVGRRRCQIEGNHIGVAERAPDDVFRRQLVILPFQAHQAAAPLLVERCRLDSDTAIHERLADALEIFGSDFLRRAGTGDLNRRIVRIEIGRRINKGDREHCQNQQVFPERESIEHDAARLMNAGRLARPVGVE